MKLPITTAAPSDVARFLSESGVQLKSIELIVRLLAKDEHRGSNRTRLLNIAAELADLYDHVEALKKAQEETV